MTCRGFLGPPEIIAGYTAKRRIDLRYERGCIGTARMAADICCEPGSSFRNFDCGENLRRDEAVPWH